MKDAENVAIQPALILCVEDEAYIREELVRELKRSNYDVIQASHGVEALQLLKKRTPDLIVSDILMPEMDGLELLKKVRSSSLELSAIPFLFLSALSDRERISEAYRNGVDDYLVKPIDLDIFILKVEAKIRLVHRLDNRRVISNPGENASKLSPRELDVLIHIVDGKKNSDIASLLEISTHTVNDYVKNIFKKLDVHSRAEAVKESIKRMIVKA